MAIDSDFVSILRNLVPEDPVFPPRPWESIASESGSLSSHLLCKSSSPTIYDPSTVSEAMLVRLVVNALQGVKSALDNIDKLSAAFCSNPADRTVHRNPSLWHRSSSTNALGEALKAVGHSGLVFFLLRKFVDYFLGANLNIGGESRDNEHQRGRQQRPKLAGNQPVAPNGDINHGNEMSNCPPYSLVNQAFSVAVGKVLEGYLCALNTLFSSVQLRHSKSSDASGQVSTEVGSLTSVVHSEISVLEVYLHTKELRTHIEALGHICFAFSMSYREDFTAKISSQFNNFPKGADLLTYLYVQLRDADPVHRALLKFLFVRSCEPYCGFIKSWIYKASVNDPFKEFIVEHVDDSSLSMHGRGGYTNGFSLACIKERDVSVPCFLKDVCRPLLRAGQQLQVLIKLLDMCTYVTTRDQSYGRGPHLLNLADILPCWNDSSSVQASCSFPLTFSERNIEAMVLERETMYRMMQEKLENLLPRLSVRCWQISSSVLQFYTVPFLLDDSLISPPSSLDKVTTNLAAAAEDEDTSNTSYYFPIDTDDSLSSECSSLTSSEDRIESQGSTELQDILVGSISGDLSSSGLTTCLANQSRLEKPPPSERLWYLEFVSNKTCERMSPTTCLAHPHHKDMELTQFSAPSLQSGNPKSHRVSKTSDADSFFEKCWPLGALMKNPFSAGGYHRPTHLRVTGYSQKIIDRNLENEKMEDSKFDQVFDSGISDLEIGMGKMQLENGKHKTKMIACTNQSWNLRYNNNLLSLNPMLTRNAWYHMTCNSRDTNKLDDRKSSIPHYEFSAVEDPCEVYRERFHTSPDHEFRVGLTDSDVSAAKGMDECPCEQYHDGDEILVDPINQSVFCTSISSSNTTENLQEEDLSTSVSGRAKWESLLSSSKDASYSANDAMDGAGGHRHSSKARFEMPLDIIVNKCIVHEILLQYQYVSNFTIKLLEEGFDLQGHLLALRHYHFMELADWADSFITSLWNHKWFFAEANQKLSEIQGFLDLALQRSSCECNHYKERLFVYMKGQGKASLSTSVIGVRAFDFIGLGYRVDWPISIVLTPDALKIYAEIFSFLTQVKLAVFSLTDIWRLLKGLKIQDSGPDRQEMKYFNVLMKMRQQVNHFVSTLQQYVQSQLSHVSWCRFSYSLKHQVKDMLDLESVHMAYLADSLHICFLSVETRPVASFIESILQCALDFRLCFAGGGWNVGSSGEDTLKLLAHINFFQVLAIKATFEENLKDLYLCYLKLPKNREFGLSQFWEYLNFNDYFSSIIN